MWNKFCASSWLNTEIISHYSLFLCERGNPVVYIKLYNILCTVNTQHTSRQDAIITIRLYFTVDITYLCDDTRIPLCCWHIYSTIIVWTTVRPEYTIWRFSFTILPYYSTVLIISENFHVSSCLMWTKWGPIEYNFTVP